MKSPFYRLFILLELLSLLLVGFPLRATSYESVSSHTVLPIWWSEEASPQPAIALLRTGEISEAKSLFDSLHISYNYVPLDFAPNEMHRYPVLFIPAGGLNGLAVPSLAERLSSYMSDGGTVLVAPQAYGRDLSNLPTSLAGRGWEEVNAPRDAAVTMRTHLALAGCETETQHLLLAGTLSPHPSAEGLIWREEDATPAVQLIPVGAGSLIVTTLAMERAADRYTAGDLFVWRDLLNWAMLHTHLRADLQPNQSLSLPVHLGNSTALPAASVQLRLLDPNHRAVLTHTLPIALPSGATLTHTMSLTTSRPLGLWEVEVTLLDSQGRTLATNIGAAFAVRHPPVQPLTLTLTTPRVSWTQNTSASWSITIHNQDTAQHGPLTLRYGLPRHTIQTGDLGYGGYEGLTIPVGIVEAHSVLTVPLSHSVLTSDQLFASLYEGTIRRAWIAQPFTVTPPTAMMSVSLPKVRYQADEPLPVSIAVTETSATPFTATATLSLQNTDNTQIIATFPVTQKHTLITRQLIFPPTLTHGLYSLQLTLAQPNQPPFSFDQTNFEIPVPTVTIALQEPADVRLGHTNRVTFVLTLNGGTHLRDSHFLAWLHAPNGQVLWQAETQLTLTTHSQTALSYTVPLSAALGEHRFVVELWPANGALITQHEFTLPASYTLLLSADHDRYAPGDTAHLTLTVHNDGDTTASLSVTLDFPATSFTHTSSLIPDPNSMQTQTYTIPLTNELPSGLLPLTFHVTLDAGPTFTRTFTLPIWPTDLYLSLRQRTYIVGETIPLSLVNVGGGQADVWGQVTLLKTLGHPLISSYPNAHVSNGSTTTIPLTLPDDLSSGNYILKARLTPYAGSGWRHDHPSTTLVLTRVITLQGTTATLHLAPQPLYFPEGHPFTATTWITNTGTVPLSGTLDLQALSMLGAGPLAGIVQDTEGRRLVGARVIIDEHQATWSNVEGEYRLESVSAGPHHFYVERVGYQVYSATHITAGPQHPITLTLSPRATAELSGIVRTGSMTLVIGADVALNGISVALNHLRTGGGGAYHFAELTPGSYTLTVTAPGFYPLTVTNYILHAGHNVQDFSLTPLPGTRYTFPIARPYQLSQPQQHIKPQPMKPHKISKEGRIWSRQPSPPTRPQRQLAPQIAVSGTITTDTTWTLTNSPYTLTADLIITSGVTLTITEGVIVKGEPNTELLVRGRLVAQGTPTRPITFTATDETSGGWSGLVFQGSSASGDLRHVVIRYSGNGNSVLGSSIGSALTIDDVTGGEVSLDACSILSGSHSTRYDAIHVNEGRVSLSGTLVTGNGSSSSDYVLYANGPSTYITLTRNTFRDNNGQVLRFTPEHLHHLRMLSNTFTASPPYALIEGGTVSSDTTLPLVRNLRGYETDGRLTVQEGVTLTIAPGIEMRSTGADLYVQGHLIAQGTPTAPITFASTAQAPKTWEGLYFRGSGSSGHLAYVTVRDAGQSGSGAESPPTPAAIYVRDSPQGITLQHGYIISNSNNGILNFGAVWIDDSHATISDTIFTINGDNSGDNDYALRVTNISTVTIFSSTFHHNLVTEALRAEGIMTLSNVTFEDNLGSGARLAPSNWERAANLTFISQTAGIDEGELAHSFTLPVRWNVTAYHLFGSLIIPQGITLTLPPDLLLRGANKTAEILVKGHLHAIGTLTHPIILTSINDQPTGWAGLNINGGTGELDSVIVRGAGNGTAVRPRAGIWLHNQGSLTLRHSAILSNSYGGPSAGIRGTTGGHAIISDTLLAYNGNGSGDDYGLYATGSGTAITMTHVTVRDNNGIGVSSHDQARLIMRHSRVWGNGPPQIEGGPSTNPDVRYTWWGTSTPTATMFDGEVLTQPWIISSTFVPGYFALTNDHLEPNDLFASATPVTINTTIGGLLGPAGDQDIYRIELEESGQLLLIADTNESRLSLHIALYATDESLLTSADTPMGDVLTITKNVDPGRYYIGLTAAGLTPSSHRPYRLTLLLADPRTDLVTQTLAQQGFTYDLGRTMVQLAPGESCSVTGHISAGQTVAEGYYLQARLTNAHDQLIGEAQDSFFVHPNPFALTLYSNAPTYRPGQTITLTGQVIHQGAQNTPPLTLTLFRNSEPFYTAQFTLPSGGTHSYLATTRAPTATTEFTISAAYSGTWVNARYATATPQLSFTLDAPQLAFPGLIRAWSLLDNPGPVPVTTTLDFYNLTIPVTLPPRSTRQISRTLFLTQSETLFVHLSDPVTRTLTTTVHLTSWPTCTWHVPIQAHAGTVYVPITITNEGNLPLAVGTDFSETPLILPASATWHQAHPYSLPAGTIPVTATLYVSATSNPAYFDHQISPHWKATRQAVSTLQAAYKVQMTAHRAPTVTVTLTNTGWQSLRGTVRTCAWRTNTCLALTRTSFSLPSSTPLTLTTPLILRHVSPGPYTVTVTAFDTAGKALASVDINGTQTQASLTLDFPTSPLTAGIIAPYPFRLANHGNAPTLADVSLSLPELHRTYWHLWIGEHETRTLTASIGLPADMASGSLKGHISLNGKTTPLTLWMHGVSLTTNETIRPHCGRIGERLSVTLSISNTGNNPPGTLTALLALNGQAQRHPITHALTFPLTATFSGDQRFFFAYSGSSGRILSQGTRYLRRCYAWLTLSLDRQTYRPGDTIHVTPLTTLTQGTLTTRIFDTSTTHGLTPFELTVPTDATRGTHILTYVLRNSNTPADELTRTLPFEVRAPWPHIIDAKLTMKPTAPGEMAQAQLTATLKDASSQQVIPVQAQIIAPNGHPGPLRTSAITLAPNEPLNFTILAPLGDTQMGFHQLAYRLADISGALGVEIGPASLEGVTTNRPAYPTANEPVSAVLSLYAPDARIITAHLKLDDDTSWQEDLILSKGQQTQNVTLPQPLTAGRHTLGVTLQAAGLTATRSTSFAYGIALPDLHPHPPRFIPGAAQTVTLQARIDNPGLSPATSPIAFYAVTSRTNTLVGTAHITALTSMSNLTVSVPWNPTSRDTPYTVTVIADPTKELTEFNESNNTASALIQPPRFYVLLYPPLSTRAGVTASGWVLSANLLRTLPQPVTTTITIYDPEGTPVYTLSTTRILSPGGVITYPSNWIQIAWHSPLGAMAGRYTVEQISVDSFGEWDRDKGTFSIPSPLYLPLLLRNAP